MTLPEYEFLKNSNEIESVYDNIALEDAVDAWEYAKSRGAMTYDLVLEVHRRLMQRKNPRIAGALRKVNVYVGDWKAPNPGQVRRLVIMWADAIETTQTDLIAMQATKLGLGGYAQKVHIEFEKIHPFEDGNGRTGRILYNWHRLQMGLPLHVIHTGPEQWDYYEWFQ